MIIVLVLVVLGIVVLVLVVFGMLYIVLVDGVACVFAIITASASGRCSAKPLSERNISCKISASD